MKRRLLYLLLVAIMALPVAGALLPLVSQRASAATADQTAENNIKNASLNWVDFGTIKAQVGNNTYFFKYKPAWPDHLGRYKIQGDYPCFAAIDINPDDIDNKTGPGKVSLDMDYQHSDPAAANTSAVSCVNVGDAGDSVTRPIGSTDKFGIRFYLSQDGKAINSWDGDGGWDFAQTAQYDNLYARTSEKECQDIIQVDKPNNTYKLYELTSDVFKSGGSPPASIHAASGCLLAKNKSSGIENGSSYPLGIPSADSQTAGSGSAATAAGTDGSGADNKLECDGSSSALSWIICPVVDGLVKVIAAVDAMVTDQLSIETSPIFGNGSTDCAKGTTCDSYKTAWRSFRNIALGLMAIAGLVMVIAQALGMEILDAYTIRKTLPRVLIAAIGITLSWTLMNFLVTLTNDLGHGIRHLIAAPFSGLNDEIHLSFGGDVGGFILGLGAIATGLLGLLTYAGAAALAVLVAIVVLILRQIVIIVLILVAPIAIVAYILPNTQQYYKFWWGTFSKALLMFPFIAAIIAAGQVFSAIAIQNDSDLNQIIGFAAYFAPYFLIPAAFRFAGGALAQIGGFVNDRGRGGFDRLRNIRANRTKQRMETYGQKFKTGEFHNPIPGRFHRTRAAVGAPLGAINSLGRRSASGVIRGGFGFGARGRTAMESRLFEAMTAAAKEPEMQNPSAKNDNATQRLLAFYAKFGGDQVQAEKALEDWYGTDKNEYNRKFEGNDLIEKLATAKANVANIGGYTPGRAAAALINMAQDGTAIRDLQDLSEVAAWVSEGSPATAYNLMSEAGSISKTQKNRPELMPAQEKRADLAGAAVKQFALDKRNPDRARDAQVENYDQILDAATMSGAGGGNAYAIMSGSPERVVRANIEKAMGMVQKHLKDPASVSFANAAQAASVIRSYENNKSYATPDNAIAVSTAMDRIDEASGKSRREVLEDFLDKGTVPAMPPTESVPRGQPVRLPGPATREGVAPTRPETVREYVERIASSGGPTRSQDQIQAMMGGRPEPPEPQDPNQR